MLSHLIFLGPQSFVDDLTSTDRSARLVFFVYPLIPFALLALAAYLARSSAVAKATLVVTVLSLVIGTSVIGYYFATDDWWGLLYIIIPLWEGPIALILLIAAIYSLIRNRRNARKATVLGRSA